MAPNSEKVSAAFARVKDNCKEYWGNLTAGLESISTDETTPTDMETLERALAKVSEEPIKKCRMGLADILEDLGARAESLDRIRDPNISGNDQLEGEILCLAEGNPQIAELLSLVQDWKSRCNRQIPLTMRIGDGHPLGPEYERMEVKLLLYALVQFSKLALSRLAASENKLA